MKTKKDRITEKTISERYSKRFLDNIETVCSRICDAIIVVVGDTKIISITQYSGNIIDENTFGYVEDSTPFSADWSREVLKKILSSTSFTILSYPQYKYFTSHINPEMFKGRIVFLEDNSRKLFPMENSGFIQEKDESLDGEYPFHQSGQQEYDGLYYYNILPPNGDEGEIIRVFDEVTPRVVSFTPKNAEFIDPYVDNMSLDLFINDCYRNGNFAKTVYIQQYRKQIINEGIMSRIRSINYILNEYGGNVFFVSEEKGLTEQYAPKESTIALLRRYWGDNAAFRNLKLYRNPNDNADIIELSQARVVETLIEEYENAKNGRGYRDVFLTAPTGAGKSLLFQLPSFYISEKKDVTIVISPLIALMKDQVEAIKSRGFQKVAYINSEVSLIDRDTIIEQCQNGQIDILYMAPELLMSYDVSYFIGTRKIGLIVIDEAHLITTWGRDFRVDYWYLGNHIQKIRKYQDSPFPMIAVTATAVYGGDNNDMVFDTTDSLCMHYPHYFIGMVKRDNIEFLINNYDRPGRNFDKEKIKQTTEFICKANELGYKTLVYAPYSRQVRQITTLANTDTTIAVSYSGKGMDSISKEESEKAFRTNQQRVMVCTKAFGMGVDIPDIQVVYHHAPSGLLPDYVQEIGRVARDQGIHGFAALNYCLGDQQYSKKLYGMSSIKLWQLKAILRKLYYNYHINGNKRNMLVSVDDFAFAFDNSSEDGVGTKVKTALMMLEKDYLAKYRFNVIIARPKELFSKVFAKMSVSDWNEFSRIYPKMAVEISRRQDNTVIVKMDLSKIWAEHFSSEGFPNLKRRFYSKSLFRSNGLDVTPEMRMSFKVEDIEISRKKLEKALDIVKSFFAANPVREFEKDDMVKALKAANFEDRIAKELASFILKIFSGEELTRGVVDNNAFLQVKYGIPNKYRVFGTRYEASFQSILSYFSKLFFEESLSVCRYVEKENALSSVRLGQLMDILEAGSFEIEGGEEPMIFIRLNSPERVMLDSKDPNYKNTIYDKVADKHEVSSMLFDHFFTRSFSNEERWNFIEDFFLGENCDELIRKYPGREVHRTDIIEILRNRDVNSSSVEQDEKKNSTDFLEYPPRKGTYKPGDHLTIEVDGQKITRTIREWIDVDVESFYKVVKDHTIYVDRETVYDNMMIKIQTSFPDLWKKINGLRLTIDMPNFKKGTPASVPYNNDPVAFYKWWKQDRSRVYLTKAEQINLFDRVRLKSPGDLLLKDLNKI